MNRGRGSRGTRRETWAAAHMPSITGSWSQVSVEPLVLCAPAIARLT
jgi:hypothetical protein